MSCIIDLPWPAEELFPNYRSRSHWPKARATKAARTHAHWATIAAKAPPVGNGAIVLSVVMYPPSRRMDDDNIKSSFKAYRDGIADGLGINDKRFQPTIKIGEPVPGGKVRVTIMEAQS